jgi:hypothetical protein
MAKYIHKQKHSNTCGAIAIANVYRHFGYKMSVEEAIELSGGHKYFNKVKGMRTDKMVRLLKKHFDVMAVHISLREAKYFSSFDEYAVLVSYGFLRGNRGNVHVAMLRHGKGINVGKSSQIIGKRWKDTKRILGFPPIVFIIKRKK